MVDFGKLLCYWCVLYLLSFITKVGNRDLDVQALDTDVKALTAAVEALTQKMG
jgi:hypothetical protein